jgi:hypothetical protein
VKSLLGDTHLISTFVEKVSDYSKAIKSSADLERALDILLERLPNLKTLNPARVELDAIYDKYPLLNMTDRYITVLWEDKADVWAQYILAMDKP